MLRLPRSVEGFGAALGLLLALTHCGGGGLTLPDDAAAAGITKITGDNQQGLPGSPLPDLLAVKVTDKQGGPLTGLKVAFSLDGDAPPGAQVTPAQARTGSDGMARASWVLGTASGPQAVVARVLGNDALQVRFQASLAAGDPAHIELVSGDGQSGSVGIKLGDPLVVRISDQFGNPVANVSVNWDGDGRVDPATSETGDDGQASTSWTLGSTTGSQTATASSTGLDGSPVSFAATALAGSANRLVQVSGDHQSGAPGSELGQPLVVRLLDRNGNGISGRAVSWVVGAGAGRVASATNSTDADGKANTRWTLGSSPGTNTLNAVVSGVGVVGFSATARSEGGGGGGGGGGGAEAARLAFLTQPSGTREGKRISPPVQVVVLDAQGNRFTGREIEVKLELTGDHDGRLGGNRAERTSSGVATFSDLSVSRRGTYSLHATADGLQAADSDRFDVTSKRGGGDGGGGGD